MPQGSEVSLIIYDILGMEVARLLDGYWDAGYHKIQWDGRNQRGIKAPTGIYFAQLAAPKHTESIKMVLLK
jgi:flagellar hook assembly protein FlgD